MSCFRPSVALAAVLLLAAGCDKKSAPPDDAKKRADEEKKWADHVKQSSIDAKNRAHDAQAQFDADQRGRYLKEAEPYTSKTKLAPDTAVAWLNAKAHISWHERTNSSYPPRPEHVLPPGGHVLKLSALTGPVTGMDKLPAPEEPFVFGFEVTGDAEREAKALPRFPTCVGIVATGSTFRPTMIETVTKLPDLRMLDFNQANVTDAHAAAIAACKNLEHLNVQMTHLTDRGVAQLAKLTKLKSLGLFAAPHTAKALPHLEGLADLEWLSIQGDNLTAAEAAPLAKLTKLRTLESHWALGDAGLAAVKDLPELRQVTVSPSATVACIDALKQMKKLEVIDCQQVTPALVAKLRAALPQCKVIADK